MEIIFVYFLGLTFSLVLLAYLRARQPIPVYPNGETCAIFWPFTLGYFLAKYSGNGLSWLGERMARKFSRIKS